jgi:hypothetical protein
MFAALLAILLTSGVDEADEMVVPSVAARSAVHSDRQPSHREHCHCWLRGLPYSQAFYSQNGYDFRRERNIPWAVRANYSLPISAAADSRTLVEQAEPSVILSEPHAAPLPPEPKASKATESGATGSK